MKKTFVALFLIVLFCSCKKNNPEPTNPNIDFTIDNTFTMFDFFLHNINADCSVASPYWENKTLKIKGVLDTFSYSFGSALIVDNLGSSQKITMILPIADSDSANIINKIRLNTFKLVVIKVACKTSTFSSNTGCEKMLSPTIEKAEDIVVQ